jgi:hypothetical protein
MPELTAVITALIAEGALCVSCISTKAGEPSAVALGAALDDIRRVLQLRRAQARCRGCGKETIVLSVDRPRP